ncbi:hypothetical protein H4S02_003203 [Coemansia sp. RSA 2611]|nr:hypothetical protein H4S02_003203 [Coemansia sp. RSA 2611]
MSDLEASKQPDKRRRLFSRRELRHQGTRIVRVGSANVLQTNRGQYNFAAASRRQPQDPTPPQPEVEPIEATDTESQSKAVHVEESDAERAPKPAAPRKVYRLTQLSERARRLQVSPSQQRRMRPLFQVDRLWTQSPDLPPPLNLDQTILSFPERASLASSRRLTPVRSVPTKLRPVRHQRPLFSPGRRPV